MPRQTNAEYWAQRMKNMEDALKDQSYSYVENMEAQFAAAQVEVEKQLSVWYQRFAKNNEISLADAKRLLTSGELEEFHWTVGEYIAYGQQNALDGAWMKQLENASARVHISRLDAIKLQIQQQAEVLYSNQLDFVDAAARDIYLGSYYGTAFEVQRSLGVGWTMQAVNEETITKVLSRPWTTDMQTFRDRCWTNKQSLVSSVNTQLSQMIIRGEAPDRAISAITKQFDVSRKKAGRLVMTESAYFASAAQKDCYGALGVERYKVVATFDKDTCDLCGALDGKVFKLPDYQVGLTAPPFHPWCRCCTCPWFEDMKKLGERWYRAPDGTTGKVPADMSFDEWKGKYVKESGLTHGSARSTLNSGKTSKNEGDFVRYVGKLDRELYKCVTSDIATDDVIITSERIQHIKEHHPGHFETIEPFLQTAIVAPDYILKDAVNTGLILKQIEEKGKRIQVVLRLHTSTDTAGFKNSIISAWEISESRWNNYLRNKNILYKRE